MLQLEVFFQFVGPGRCRGRVLSYELTTCTITHEKVIHVLDCMVRKNRAHLKEDASEGPDISRFISGL